MRVHVHVGVHKTATSYLQMRLADNVHQLNAQGVGYMPLGKLREFLTSRLMTLVPGEFRIEDHLDMFFPDGVPSTVRGLIISDENLIGSCAKLVNSGHPFKPADHRLAQLKKLLEGHDIALFVSVRSYDTFLASAYCEALRGSEFFIWFERFLNRLERRAMRWPLLVDHFATILSPTDLKVWRYEDFRTHMPEIMRGLAFGADLEFKGGQRSEERASFSDTAIKVLGLIARRVDPKVAARLIDPVGLNLPKAEGYAAFDPWNAEEKAAWGALYAQDCREIPEEYWLVPLPPANVEPVAEPVDQPDTVPDAEAAA